MVFLPTISSSKINPIATTRFAFLKQNSHLHTALIKKQQKKNLSGSSLALSVPHVTNITNLTSHNCP